MAEEHNEESPLYPNQPLLEVATEVRFLDDLMVETYRPQFQSKISDEYPRCQINQGMGLVLPQYRFKKNDDSAGVQWAINSFSYQSRAYLGASHFINEAMRLLEITEKLLEQIRVTRIGWRYINAIPFIRENNTIPLARYFTENSIFGTGLQGDYDTLSLDASAPINDSHLHIKVDSVIPLNRPKDEAMIVDIDVYRVEDGIKPLSISLVRNFILDLHEQARSVFESLITEEYRNFLKGDDNG